MASERLEILLDEPLGAYFSGQNLRGKVRFTTDKTIKVKALKLVVKGKHLATWKEGKTVYQTRTKILKHECPLNLPADHEKSFSLSPGSYEYPFEFIIGPNLPTSIESHDGYVRYYLQAIVDHTGLKRDEQTTMGFTVNKVVDLNQLDRVLLEPYSDERERTPCCTSQLICLKGSVERPALVPGETIIFNGSAEISGGKFRKTSLTLYWKNVFHCDSAKRENLIVLWKEKRTGSTQFDQWNRIAMKIPPVPPTNLNNVLDVEYFIQVDPGFGHRNFTLDIPIAIGNVPLLNTFPNWQEPPRDPAGGSLSLLLDQLDAKPNSSMSAVPAWFEEAYGKELVGKPGHGDAKFLKRYWPRYAYYKAIDDPSM